MSRMGQSSAASNNFQLMSQHDESSQKHVQFSDNLHVQLFDVSAEEVDRERCWDDITCFFMNPPTENCCCAIKCSFLDWCLFYKWNEQLLRDIIAGVMVALMYIPQGLAHADIANIPVISGLYVGIFPAIIYVIFGTSSHVSIGTYSVISYMTGTVIKQYISGQDRTSMGQSSNTTTSTYDSSSMDDCAMQLVTSVSFVVGVTQFLMYCCGLHVIFSYISNTYVSGFTAGVSFHIIIYLLREILGLRYKPRYGPLTVFYTFMDLAYHIDDTNFLSLGYFLCSALLLILDFLCLNPILRNRTGFIFPTPLIVIVISILVGTLTDVYKNFDVPVIASIPVGLPVPEAPGHVYTASIVMESAVIAFVSYFFTTKIGLTTSTNVKEIEKRQELFALGAGNMIGSCFQCLPSSGSVSRSNAQKLTGGTSQISNVVTIIILTGSVYVIGPYFSNIPQSVLASINFIGALEKIITHITIAKKVWNTSRSEVYVWLITFFSVVIIDVYIGLLCGLFYILYSVTSQNTNVHVCQIGRIKITNQSMYASFEMSHGLGSEIIGVKIIQICGPFTFSSMNNIIQKIYTLSGVNPKEVRKLRKQIEKGIDNIHELMEELEESLKSYFKLENINREDLTTVRLLRAKLSYIIIDLTLCSARDASALCSLATLIKAYKELGVEVLVVDDMEDSTYYTITEAVESIEHNRRPARIKPTEDIFK